jgi:hypothetical protein
MPGDHMVGTVGSVLTCSHSMSLAVTLDSRLEIFSWSHARQGAQTFAAHWWDARSVALFHASCMLSICLLRQQLALVQSPLPGFAA